jgi:hypothetical protein
VGSLLPREGEKRKRLVINQERNKKNAKEIKKKHKQIKEN